MLATIRTHTTTRATREAHTIGPHRIVGAALLLRRYAGMYILIGGNITYTCTRVPVMSCAYSKAMVYMQMLSESHLNIDATHSKDAGEERNQRGAD